MVIKHYFNKKEIVEKIEISKNDAIIARYEYLEFDGNGNRTKVRETSWDATIVTEYSYDELNRLTDAVLTDLDDEIIQSYHYIFNDAGNIEKKTVFHNENGVFNKEETVYAYDSRDRLITDSTNNYTWDNNGSMLSDGTFDYYYDSENRLIRIEAGSAVVAEYQYDPEGIRIGKTINNKEISYLVDKNRPYAQIIEEYTDNNLTASYIHAGRTPLSRNESYYLTDIHGSVRFLADNTGITDTYDYDSYGNITAQTGTTENNLLYTGEQFDPETGDYYLRARYMNPETGRFTQMDTWSGSLSKPVTLNKYLYADGNPVMGVDPSGNMTIMEAMTVVAVVGIMASCAEPSVNYGFISGANTQEATQIWLAHLSALKNLNILQNGLANNIFPEKTKQLMGYYFDNRIITHGDESNTGYLSLILSLAYKQIYDGLSGFTKRDYVYNSKEKVFTAYTNNKNLLTINIF